MAIEPKKFQIRIESILGGRSAMTHFSQKDQFGDSYGIDPSQSPYFDQGEAGGLITPITGFQSLGNTASYAPLLWIKDQPKQSLIYAYGSNGSSYYIDESGSGYAFNQLGGADALANSSGNGMEYYDNYMYFATNTSISRYGPLNSNISRAFTSDYWGTTLGKTYLTNNAYPKLFFNPSIVQVVPTLPNHIMHRHSDGKLYIADVQNNQGNIHYISTTKTTVEGDTDNGSTFGALTFGYGLWPTAIESYGSSLVVALIEADPNSVFGNVGSLGRLPRAKLAFWDTTSQNFNTILFEEFGDSIITAMKNVNGVLYIWSTNSDAHFSGGTLVSGMIGYRISRYIGGSSFEEVQYIENEVAPMAGAVDGSSNRLLFGSGSGTYSFGLQKSVFGQKLYRIYPSTTQISGGTNSNPTTAIALKRNDLNSDYPIQASWDGSIYFQYRLGTATVAYWESQIYKIGQPFKITKIRIPLAIQLSAGQSIVATILTQTTPFTFTIDDTKYLNQDYIVLRPTNCTGNHFFSFSLQWGATSLISVALPITIEYELVDTSN